VGWRGVRPKVSSEVRHLIARMARETFSGERRGSMANFSCSGSASTRPPCRLLAGTRQTTNRSWRSFFCNQTGAFGQIPYFEERSKGYTRPHVQSYWAKLMRSAAAQIATVVVGLCRGLGQQPPNPERSKNYSAVRAARSRRDAQSACARYGSGAALPIRSPPHKAWASPSRAAGSRCHLSAESCQISSRWSMIVLTPQTHQRRCEPSAPLFASPFARIRF
jgi:hypothetical protein